ncbi:hypothetical protein NDU88_002714 [Pleurodeles waltl]|uniref:Uncharacterized protein n=1 Tax=Pleurodeles waltl TaxID=8319 RepID=A0AAV7M1E2_PLEWA|nr:hypothetical protein NDU88_002714 [Pleurodeles waltl]
MRGARWDRPGGRWTPAARVGGLVPRPCRPGLEVGLRGCGFNTEDPTELERPLTISADRQMKPAEGW